MRRAAIGRDALGQAGERTGKDTGAVVAPRGRGGGGVFRG